MFLWEIEPCVWFAALALAELKSHPKYKELREKYMKWLMETKQEERAGELKEKDGDYDAALSLYLKAGLPTRASRWGTDFLCGTHNACFFSGFRGKIAL